MALLANKTIVWGQHNTPVSIKMPHFDKHFVQFGALFPLFVFWDH